MDLMTNIEPAMTMDSCMDALLGRPPTEGMYVCEDVGIEFSLDELLDTLTRCDASVFNQHAAKVEYAKENAARAAATRIYAPRTHKRISANKSKTSRPQPNC